MSGEKKLESLLGRFIDDERDGEELVRADLEGFGVDVQAEKRKFRALLDGLEARARRRVLDEARDARVSRADRRERKLNEIKQQQLPLHVLARKASELGGARAHRDLEKETREDLESYLADLLLDAEDEG